jgi:transposase
MFEEIRADHATDWEAMGQVAQLIGVSTAETVRKWVLQVRESNC